MDLERRLLNTDMEQDSDAHTLTVEMPRQELETGQKYYLFMSEMGDLTDGSWAKIRSPSVSEVNWKRLRKVLDG